MKPLVRIAILASACSALALAGPINYVTNGGFESGASSGVFSNSFPGDLIYVFGVGGATNIDGWSVSAGPNSNGSGTPLSVLVTGNPPQTPAGGSYAVDFDPFWNIQTGAILGPTVTGTLPEISQTVNLPAGQFVLSFNGAEEQPDLDLPRSLGVTLTGAATLTEVASTTTPDNVGWDFFSYIFTSSGGAVTLTFIPDDFSPEPNFMLDNVAINAAPEPSTAIPMALGALVLLLALRMRRYPWTR